MKLHAGRESGNSYKLRVFLGLLGVPYEIALIDLATREHKAPGFMRLNPRGQVPVLEDGEILLWDSGAALVYLARKFERDDWLPADPAGMATVLQWVFMAESEIQFGLQYARRGVVRGRWIAGTLEELQAIGRVGLVALESRLSQADWLALDRPTIADIACFPYVETAPEAQIDLGPYPGIGRWLARCAGLPGWPGREITQEDGGIPG